MKKILALILLLVFPLSALASTQVILGGTNQYNNTGQTTQYTSFTTNMNQEAWGNTINNALQPFFPTSGTISLFQVHTTSAPGVGNSYTFTLYKNSTATSITCTITDTNRTCTDLADTVAVTSVDTLTPQMTHTGTAASTTLSLTVDFTPTTDGDTVIMGRTGNFNQTQESYNNFFARVAYSVLAAPALYNNILFPEGGTVDQYNLQQQIAPGSTAASSSLFALLQNSATTSISLNLFGNMKNASDTVDSITVADGDLLSIATVPTGNPALPGVAGHSIRFHPYTKGDFPLMGGGSINGNDISNVVTYYDSIAGTAASTSEAASQQISNPMTITKLEVVLATAPGTNKSRTFTLRQNGNSTALSCTISGTATKCTMSGSISINSGDLIDTMVIPSGTPASSASRISYVATTQAQSSGAKHSFTRGLIRFLGGFFRFH